MGCKRMSESMRTYIFLDSSKLSQPFNNSKNHSPSQLCSSPIQKQEILVTRLYNLLMTNIFYINFNFSCSGIRNRHESLFRSFSQYANEPFIKIKFGEAQINKL